MTANARLVISVLIYALALLSIAAGIPKVLQMSQELAFLSAIGLSGYLVSLLGVVQLVGGALLLFRRTRLLGAILAGLALLVSSIAIFASGDTMFGAVSLTPTLLVFLVVYLECRA